MIGLQSFSMLNGYVDNQTAREARDNEYKRLTRRGFCCVAYDYATALDRSIVRVYVIRVIGKSAQPLDLVAIES
jgi:hypothetical protein